MSKEAMKLALEALEECRRDPRLKYEHPIYDKAIKALEEALAKQEQGGCAECGIGGCHALYCVRCSEKFVGGYKENVPVHTSKLLTQVSTDTQYAGNGTAGIQNETKPTGYFFQMPKQEHGEPVAILQRYPSKGLLTVDYTDEITEVQEGTWPLYTTPQQRKPLTDDELLRLLSKIDECAVRLPRGLREFARAIEAAHGIKE